MSAIKSFAAIFRLEVKYSLLKPLSQHYDVFISYSHRNTEKAREVLDTLQKMNSDLNIFFDKSELKTGNSVTNNPNNSYDSWDLV